MKVWNLLDVLSLLSDDEECDPALLFWLAEELLDSQTIAGCRKIFDFLESRRERITANHFKQKQLIILRTCNELLRRLSRAEDTAFCGRVFIFMFQSFPLGDKSSVNLRGEFHVENVTTYETVPADDDSKMAVDEPEEPSKEQPESKSTPKSADVKKGDKDKPLSTDELYPLFWSLQEYFSQPKRLFETANLSSFKESLAATMSVFQTVHNDARRSLKRKRETGEEDESSNAFNPKYLTSKDLFDLEVYSRLHSFLWWEANNTFRSVISHSDDISLCKPSLLWTFLSPYLLKLGRDLRRPYQPRPTSTNLSCTVTKF